MKRNPSRTKAFVIAGAVIAGTAAAGAPAQAQASGQAVQAQAELSDCTRGGLHYVCEWKRAVRTLPNGAKQEFVVGTADRAVWTRWTDTDGDWSKWLSMGGVAAGTVSVDDYDHDDDGWTFNVNVWGTDMELYSRHRDHEGNWTDWFRRDIPING